jgi:hypothetical protein
MKKIILIVLMAMLTTVAEAQSKKWKIALHVDPNLSWVKPDNRNITAGDNKLKFGFGLSIDKMFTDNYAIGTGFNILNTGGQLSYFVSKPNGNGIESISEVTRSYNLQYLEVPLTLKLRTNEIGYITYWAQIGLGLGVNIKAKSDDEIQYYLTSDTTTTIGNDWLVNATEESIEDEDISDEISIFRASLIIAGGIEYNLSGDASIVAGIAYNNSFTDILRKQGVSNFSEGGDIQPADYTPKQFDLKAISNLISLQVGILF